MSLEVSIPPLGESVSEGTIARWLKRDGDTATEVVGGTMPLVLSVTDQSGEARYPSFKGIMAAKSKPVDQVTVADLERARSPRTKAVLLGYPNNPTGGVVSPGDWSQFLDRLPSIRSSVMGDAVSIAVPAGQAAHPARLGCSSGRCR